MHFNALILKRMRYYKRDLFGIACEILLPIVCVFLGLLLKELAGTFTSNQKPISFSPNTLFGKDVNGFNTYMGKNVNI